MIEFSEGSKAFQACVALVFVIASMVVILNCYAIVFLLRGGVGGGLSHQSCHKPSTTGTQRNAMILLSLCIANILFGVGVLADFTCFVTGQYLWAGAYVIAFGLIASLIHVCMLTFERFMAVKFPFQYRIIPLRTMVFVSTTVWVLSVLPVAAVRVNYKMFLMVLFVILMISDVSIVAVYTAVVIEMRGLNNRTHSKYTVQSPWKTTAQHEQQNRITAFCCIIVISYITSTLPAVIWYMIHSGEYISPYSGNTVDIILFMMLVMRASTDPLIYIFREEIHAKFSFLHSKFTNSLMSDADDGEELIEPCLDNESK